MFPTFNPRNQILFLLIIFHSNNHIQDVLVVSYLANTIRTQMDLSNRLATAQLTLGGPETKDNAGSTDNKDGQRGGQRRQNRGQGQQQREPRSTAET